MTSSDKTVLENAILSILDDAELRKRFESDPFGTGAELGLDETWTRAILDGDRDALRSAGVGDAVTIIVTRWLNEDLEDAGHSGRFQVSDAPLPDADVPAGVVFAGGCSHTPDLVVRPEIDPADAIERLRAAYGRLGESLVASRPDVIIATVDCHFQTFETGATVIGTGSRLSGSLAFFGRDDISMELTGAPTFAKQLVDAARAAGLEVEESEEVRLDHGLIVPISQLLPDNDIPVVPVITQPARTFSPFGARAFGAALRDAIPENGPRVAVLATGGLSHWLDPGEWGRVDTEFDRFILDSLTAGKGIDLANLEPFALLSHGQYEFPNWLIMLSLIGPGVMGEVLAYEPLTASGGGWVVAEMTLPDRPG